MKIQLPGFKMLFTFGNYKCVRVIALSVFILFSAVISSQAQKMQGIGTQTPNPRAVLELNVEDPIAFPQGFLLPRLTTVQRTLLGVTLNTSTTGMGVYDLTDKTFYTWDGTQWNGAGSLSFVGIGGVLVSTTGSIVTIDGSLIATQWSNNGSDIYFNAGNVGIGTSSPAFPLQILGTGLTALQIDGPVPSSQPLVNLNGTGPSLSPVFRSTSSGGGPAGDFVGDVNVSATAHLYNVQIQSMFGVAPAGSVLTVDGAGVVGYGVMQVGSSSQWTTSGTNIYYDGGFNYKVGIGTAVPGAQLEIVGAGGLTAFKVTPGASGFAGVDFQLANTYFNIAGTRTSIGALTKINNNGTSDALSVINSGGGNAASFNGNTNIYGDNSVTGIGYFGTIIGNNMFGAPVGSVVTIDGSGTLGYGILPSATLNTISGVNGISVISGTGYDFTINGANFITSIVGGNGLLINKLGQLVTVTSNAVSSQFTTSGSNIATTYNTSVAGFITATGIGSFGTIIGANLAGAAGSVVTVDGAGKLGIGSIGSSQWITTTNGIYYTKSIGIGNVNPKSLIHVSSASGASIRVDANDNFTAIALNAISSVGALEYGPGGMEIKYNNTYSSTGDNSGATVVNIDNNQNFGIGTGSVGTLTQKFTVVGNSSLTGIGYFGTIIGNNMSGAPVGSIVTIDGTGKLGYGTISTALNTITGINGISIVTGTGYDFTINGANFITSISGGNGVSINKSGQLVTITSNTISSQFTTSGSNIATNYNTSVAGFITATGIGSFGTIIGVNLAGAAGSVVTVDGTGTLGLALVNLSANNYWTLAGNNLQPNNINYNVGLTTTTAAYMIWTNTGLRMSNSGNSVLLGNGSGNTTMTGNNLIFGSGAGNTITTGSENIILGDQAGGSGASSNFKFNVLLGWRAGSAALNNQQNVMLGMTAGYFANGSGNNYIGASAGYNSNSGNNNNFFGNQAGYENTSGNSNVFIGQSAGKANTTGSGNIAIGSFSGYALGNLNNAYVIGNNASVGGSNMMMLGGIQGSGYEVKVGIGTALPNQELSVIGNVSVTGTGYFGTIIGNNMSGAPVGSIVTVNGTGKLGYGTISTALNTITGTNGISIVTGTGYDFTINGSNFITSVVGGNGISVNQLGQLVTVTSTAVSSQFTTSGANISTTYNTSVAGFITATGIGSFGTIIGANLAGAAGSVVTVDGNGILGLATLTQGIEGTGTATGVAYFTNNNTLTADGQNFTWNGTVLGIRGSSLIIQGGAVNNFFVGSLTGNTTTTGTDNVFIGFKAGQKNTTGSSNNFFGRGAGDSNVIGTNNNFFGNAAGASNVNGSSNNFFGNDAGVQNINGINNNIFGNQSGFQNTSGSNNNFFGMNSGFHNSTGADNNFLGYQAGFSNTTGVDNNFLGYNAGYSNTTGNSNIFIGSVAGIGNTVGNRNIALGEMSGFTVNNLTNAIAIGAYTSLSGSNSAVIGYGITSLGINTNSPTAMLDVNGGARIENLSATGAVFADNQGNLYVSTSSGANAWTINGTNLFPVNLSDNLGIGTSIPGQSLVVVGNASATGIGYFGTIIGNNLTSSPGSVVTVDGFGKLGIGPFPTSSQWITASSNQIFTNSFVGIGTGNPTQALSIKGNISATGIGYFGTIIGNNLIGAAGSLITVDGFGQLGLASITSGIGGTGQTNGIAYFTSTNTLTSNGTNFSWNGTVMSINGIRFYTTSTGANTSIVIGKGAANLTFTGSDNIFFGNATGFNNTGGHNNNFFGNSAGYSNTTGFSNSFFGSQAGTNNTAGSGNNIFGEVAGLNNTTGNNNNFFGSQAGQSNTAGNSNNFFGLQAGQSNTLGNNNIFIGTLSGNGNISGNRNIAIGNNTGFLSNNLSNAIAIGAFTSVSGSNSVVIGNNITSLGINTSSPSAMLDVNGGARIENLSASGAVFADNQGNLYVSTSSGANAWTVNGNNLFPVNISNNVGIGTTVLGAMLQIVASSIPGIVVTSSASNQSGTIAATTTGTNAFAIGGFANGSTVAGVYGELNGNNGYAIEGVVNSNGSAIAGIINAGNGSAGFFNIIPSTSSGVGINVQTNGLGDAAVFSVNNPLNSFVGVYMSTNGLGTGAVISVLNSSHTGSALSVSNVSTLTGALAMDVTGKIKVNSFASAGNNFVQADPTGALFISPTLTGFVNVAAPTASVTGLAFVTGVTSLSTTGNNLVWDNLNKRLGIGTSTPGQPLVVVGNTSATGTSFANDFSAKSLTLTGIGFGLLTVTGSGVVTTTSINIPASTWLNTTVGITYTNTNVAIGTNTVTGTAKFKVAGDGSMGGMVLASQGLVNPVSTQSTTTVTAVSIPVFIPAGTNDLRANFIGQVDAVGGSGNFQFAINGIPSGITSSSIITSSVLSEVALNVASLAGSWVQLDILISHSTGANSAILKGYSVVVKD